MFRPAAASLVILAALAAWGPAARPPPQTARPPATSALSPALSDTLASRRGALPGPYRAQVLRVVDGDTFEARIHVWFGQDIVTLVRIRGIDAPELKARCSAESEKAAASRDLLGDFLNSGTILLRDLSSDKYFGRVVANVETSYAEGPGDDVAALMLAADMARSYEGKTRGSWCDVALAAH